MLVLFETAAGFALFKVLDEGKLKDVNDLARHFNDSQSAQKVVSLKHFHKFENTTEALAAATAINESNLSKGLKSFLKKVMKKELKEKVAVQDPKLANVIKEKLGIQVVSGTEIVDLVRGIRTQLESLVSGLQDQDLKAMSLGLSHSLARYKLKFSPDKVDTMIVQAIALLDDLDKELNTYSMRVKEWYGWHFPELAKIVTDNLMFCRLIKAIGPRSNAASTDLSKILPEGLDVEVREAAQISMGTEINEEDIETLKELCDQVIDIHEYREQLYQYLANRMHAIAPNLTELVGELVGARLIAHVGSLLNLAKHPASTVQILGAEKALFRALKTRHETPKYGLIYHASLIGQTTAKNKGKIARVVAAKAALSCRVDALGDRDTAAGLGAELRAKVEQRIRQVDGGQIKQISGKAKTKQPEKYSVQEAPVTYNPATDSTVGLDSSKAKLEKKEKKREKKSKSEKAESMEVEEPTTPAKDEKKKKKKTQEAVTEKSEAETTTPSKKKSKKKHSESTSEPTEEAKGKKKSKKTEETSTEDGEKKKKKKSNKSSDDTTSTKKRKREEDTPTKQSVGDGGEEKKKKKKKKKEAN